MRFHCSKHLRYSGGCFCFVLDLTLILKISDDHFDQTYMCSISAPTQRYSCTLPLLLIKVDIPKPFQCQLLVLSNCTYQMAFQDFLGVYRSPSQHLSYVDCFARIIMRSSFSFVISFLNYIILKDDS